MRYRRVAGARRRSAPRGEEVRLPAAIWIEEGATDREVTPVPGHPAVGQSLAAARLSPAVAGRWPRKALAGRAAGLAPVQLDEAAAAARHLPGGVGADGPVLDAAAHRRGSVRAPRVD